MTLGVVLLGVAPSLPEVATTVTAGFLDNAQPAAGNLMGGVALQIVVLAIADFFASRRSLTLRITDPTLLVQHVVLVLLLRLTIAGMAVGEPFSLLGVGVWPLVLAAVYAGGLLLVYRGAGVTRWAVTGASKDGAAGSAPEDEQTPSGRRCGASP